MDPLEEVDEAPYDSYDASSEQPGAADWGGRAGEAREAHETWQALGRDATGGVGRGGLDPFDSLAPGPRVSLRGTLFPPPFFSAPHSSLRSSGV